MSGGFGAGNGGAEAVRPMTFRFLGTGTSAGIPVIACSCRVCQSKDLHNRRLRCAGLLRDGEASILIDAGNDIREQALAAGLSRLDGVLLTHAHSDHTSGLDELRIFNFKQRAPLEIRGNSEALADVRKRFDYCFGGAVQVGGGLPKFELIEARDPFRMAGLEVVPIPAFHGVLPILGYRIGDFAYLTDVSRLPVESIALLAGVRTLVLNALRHRPHETHLTVAEAVDVAALVGAQHTWFIHMCHDLDHAETNASLPPDKQLAHDGLEIIIDAGAPARRM